MYQPRGKVWGGSSVLNAMIYIRGNAEDFNRWEAEGAEGWSYADCLPYFQKAQCHELGGDDYRGGDGHLHVSRGKSGIPLHEAFVKAGQEAGYPYTADCNGYQQEGVGPFEMTINKGKRWSTSQAYLRPALKRSNLSVKSRALSTRILMEGNRAVGVEYEQKGQTWTARANKEVILSGGAINSPQLLLLSGIGPEEHLRSVGIEPQVNLPGVGENLQDHLELQVQHKCKEPITLYQAQWKFPHIMVGIGLKWFLTQTGWGAGCHMDTGGFIRTFPNKKQPDIQWHFLPSALYDHGRKPAPYHAFQVHTGAQQALSRGTIRLKTANPHDHPLIDPNYFSHPQDMIDMVQCIKLTREICHQPALAKYSDGEIQPGPDCDTDEKIAHFIKTMCDTAYHPSCTCKMGTDDMSVVDNQGWVHETSNLRVVDASIMPSITNGNLNAPTTMIAEKCADRIRGLSPLPQSTAPVWKPAHPEKQRDGVAQVSTV
ncbi:CHDH [Bugula neritina]|uniref:CHDH n=1 Tax=Bugula neritina TaxID=10212 RepID=A0A7J7KHJ0_BUGNE|nr:CHDH [Bugula neritina]